MLAIHNSSSGFHPRWVAYCKENKIPFKQVNCYATNILEQLADCRALMWHHSQGNPRDIVVAKQILYALEHAGFAVFPNFRTGWHFDDKLGQKYLTESLQIDTPRAYAFYTATEAIEWANSTTYPKVFKLRCGAGSANVILVRNRTQAVKLIRRSFGRGIAAYNPITSLKERWRQYQSGKASFLEPLKGLLRFFNPPPHSLVRGREQGYVYFQDFVPNNNSDTRVIVIGNRAFALKRYVRTNDFRASGSGDFGYARDLFDISTIAFAFKINKAIQTQAGVYDFVCDARKQPLLIEISYGFMASGYDECPGYWCQDLIWHPGRFNPYGWMVESLLTESSQH